MEDGKPTKTSETPAIIDPMISIATAVISKQAKEAREEQERTTIKKRMFLEAFGQTLGNATAACSKVGINRDTYYHWREVDLQFAKDLKKVEVNRNDEAEDLLFAKMRAGDTSAIRFFLNAKHGEYKKKIVNEIYAGDKTLEDLIDEQNKINAELANEQKNEKNIPPDGQPVTHPVAPEHSEQARPENTVQSEHGSDVLLEKTDAPKPDSEGSPARA